MNRGPCMCWTTEGEFRPCPKALCEREEHLHPTDRDWWALGLPNPCHSRDPRLWLYRIRHRVTGPRRGCSCTRCWNSPRRVPHSREVIDRFVRLERRVAELERRGVAS